MYKLKLKIDTSTNNVYIQDMVTVPPLTRVTRMDLVEQKEEAINKKTTNIELDEISITSSFKILPYADSSDKCLFKNEEIEGVAIEVTKYDGKKCNRCWKFKKELVNNEICERCDGVVKKIVL